MELRQETIDDFDLPLSDYYICYFDVLGYKAFFESNDKEHKKFFNELAEQTIEFCQKHHKQYHIKDGTITEK